MFRSSDFARNFVQTDLPFHPLTQMLYSPQNSDYLLALSTEVSPVELAFPCLQHHNIPALKDSLVSYVRLFPESTCPHLAMALHIISSRNI